jgi:hypothetical protein
VVAPQPRRDRPDAPGVHERADLDGRGTHIGEDRVDLLGDECRGKHFDAGDLARVLRGGGHEDGRAVDSVRGEGQQVGLNAGPAPGIRGGDRDNGDAPAAGFLHFAP